MWRLGGVFSRPGGAFRAWRPSRVWIPFLCLKLPYNKTIRAAERRPPRAGLCSTMAGSKGVKRLKLKRPRSLENQDAISEWNDAQTRSAKRQYTDFTQKQRLVLDDTGQLTGLLTFSPPCSCLTTPRGIHSCVPR